MGKFLTKNSSDPKLLKNFKQFGQWIIDKNIMAIDSIDTKN